MDDNRFGNSEFYTRKIHIVDISKPHYFLIFASLNTESHFHLQLAVLQRGFKMQPHNHRTTYVSAYI